MRKPERSRSDVCAAISLRTSRPIMVDLRSRSLQPASSFQHRRGRSRITLGRRNGVAGSGMVEKLRKSVLKTSTPNGKLPPLPHSSENNGNVESAVSERERLLLLKISELQLRMNNSNDELTAEQMRETQLKQQLNAVSGQDENGDKR